jgi:methionyl-tRNA formyltransferase
MPEWTLAPLYASKEIGILRTDTSGSLERRLSEIGGPLLLEVLENLEGGSARATPQDEALATYAPKLTADDARIDWSLPADEIERRVRAFDPRPGAWTEIGGKRIKVWRAEVDESRGGTSGSMAIQDGDIRVAAGSGVLRLLELQPEGKKRMSASEFVRGYKHLLER